MNSGDTFQNARELFERAMEQPQAEREAFVTRACGDDEKLRAEVLSLISAAEDAGEFLEESASAPMPAQIGPYRIKSVLGQGGMGTVYLAEQLEPIHREVAVKVVRSGLDTRDVITRFESEQQSLALMNHPNIARVFDAGATEDGRPYFVMEYIDGQSLVDYCDKRQLNINERLELFLQLCDGIQFAHQKGIIHRDIKPSNIIVTTTDGRAVPKIIDFGIAKATERGLKDEATLTRQGQMIGTPEYMSPEQADQQDIDTRSDVYSLGVILYELLSGGLPFTRDELRSAGYEAMLQHIREVDPPKPSDRISTLGTGDSDSAGRRGSEPRSLMRQVSGDLDWITMRAIDKNPNRRYSSPLMLADDLRRHLNHEPVTARAPGMGYRTRKFVRRHRMGVAFASVIVVSLVAFAVAMAVQAGRIASERDRANVEAASAQQVSDFLVDLFMSADPDKAKGDTLMVRDVLDKGATNVRTNEELDPLVRARMMRVLGNVYRHLGLYPQADSLLQGSLQEMRTHDAPPTDIAEAMGDYGYNVQITGNYESARQIFEEALELGRANYADDDPRLLTLINYSGINGMRRGEYDEALIVLLECRGLCERMSPVDSVRYAQVLNNLGLVYQRLPDVSMAEEERIEHALESYEHSLQIYQAMYGQDHPRVARTLINIANIYKMDGRLEEATDAQQRSLVVLRRVYGENHRMVGTAYNMMGFIYIGREMYDEAEDNLRKSIASYEHALGADHQNIAYPLQHLATIRVREENYEAALQLYLRANELRVNRLGPRHSLTWFTQKNVATTYMSLERPADAEPHYREAIAIGVAIDDGWKHVESRWQLNYCLVAQGRHSEAEAALEENRVFIYDTGLGGDLNKHWAEDQLIEFYENWGGHEAEIAAVQERIAVLPPKPAEDDTN